MSKKISRAGHGAMSKQLSNIANLIERLVSTKLNQYSVMKTILGSVAVILFAVFSDHTRLAAEETQSSEMRFYARNPLNGKRDQRLYLLAPRWPCSKATQQRKARS